MGNAKLNITFLMDFFKLFLFELLSDLEENWRNNTGSLHIPFPYKCPLVFTSSIIVVQLSKGGMNIDSITALFEFSHFPINFPFLVPDSHTVFPSWAYTVGSLCVYTSCEAGQAVFGLALMTSFSLVPSWKVLSPTTVTYWGPGSWDVNMWSWGALGDRGTPQVLLWCTYVSCYGSYHANSPAASTQACFLDHGNLKRWYCPHFSGGPVSISPPPPKKQTKTDFNVAGLNGENHETGKWQTSESYSYFSFI